MVTLVSVLYAQQFPATSINPENGQKWSLFNGRDNSFARDTRFTMDDSLYSRSIFLIPNGVYCKSLRLSIAEQLARDPNGAVQFFAIFEFSVSNAKPMAHVRTCQRHPDSRSKTKI